MLFCFSTLLESLEIQILLNILRGDADLNRFRIPLNRKENHFLVIAILNPKLNRPVNISGDVINRDLIPSKTNESVSEKKSNESAAQLSVEEVPKKRLVDPRLLRTNRQNSVDLEPSPNSNQNSPRN